MSIFSFENTNCANVHQNCAIMRSFSAKLYSILNNLSAVEKNIFVPYII